MVTKVKGKKKRQYFHPLQDQVVAKKRRFFRGKVSSKALTQFTSQLSTLQNAGLPIVRCLKILEGQMKPGFFKTTLIQVAEDVEGGSSLSEAFSKHPRVFDSLYVNMVRAGEAGGVLDTILTRLALFKEKSERLKKKIIGAFIYPVAILTFALLMLVGILLFIIPRFKEIFAGLRVELPSITLALLSISSFFRIHWYMVFGIPVLAYFIYRLVYQSARGRSFIDKAKLSIPIFGAIFKKTLVARFSRTLGTLISSGVPILESLDIVKASLGNRVMEGCVDAIYQHVREGESIATPLGESRVFDDIVVNMIDVGEKTGELDKMLAKIADGYEYDVDVRISSLTSILEPILIVLMAVIIGFIVLALFLPLVKLLETIG